MKRILCALLAVMMLVSCASTASIEDISQEYPAERYVTAIGHGDTREQAELNAKSELVAMFGSAVETATREAIGTTQKAGIVEDVLSFAQESSVTSRISSVWGMKIASSVEGKNGWDSIAYVEKRPTANWYKENLPSALDDIEVTKGILMSERGSWKAVGTANRLAQMIIDYNKDVGIYNYLSNAGYRYYNASETAKLLEEVRDSVSASIVVNGDDTGYLQSAIENAFTELGWRVTTSPDACTVAVKADINWNVEKGSGNSFIFAAFNSSLSVTDKATGHTIDVFTTEGKEGHKSEASARKRALKVLSDELIGELEKVLTAKEVR